MPAGCDNCRLLQSDWPSALTREVSRIRRWSAVESENLSVTKDEAGRVRIEFNIQTDRLLDPLRALIEDTEPITLVYRSIDAVGVHAPAVWSARADFPRDIGHINPTPPEHPASLCLARAGLQAIYDRHGVDGVLDRLSHWLRDAKTDQLMKDGWEPVPMGEGQDVGAGYFNIGYFQDLALNQMDGAGWCLGEARLLTDKLGGRVVFLTPALDLDDKAQLEAASTRIKGRPIESGVEAYIPWVFVYSDRTQPTDRQVFGVWNSYGEIEAGLEGTGIETHLPTAVMDATLRLADPESTGGRPVALLVGVWRPTPISGSVFGMASEPEARRLEIRGYLLHCEKNVAKPINPDVEAQQLLSLQLPSREMLEFASGTEAITPVALFGYGALGCCLAEFFLRAGIPRIAALDNDILEPHNLARHNATVDDMHAHKVAHLNRLAGNVTFFGDEIERNPVDCDVTTLSDEDIAKVASSYPMIIDATADERVRRHLADSAIPPETKLVRAEIFDGGRLGALFLTGPDNSPNLIDLYYELCARAVEDKAIEKWLRHEQTAEASSEELLIGMGCASATTRMPKHLIVQHATAFMSKMYDIQRDHSSAGIGINPLAQDDTPLGWRWYDYGGTVTALEAANAPGWAVRLSPHAARKLDELRLAHGDIETGGYLYGGYDFVLKQVYVISVTNVPPGTTQSAAQINLGPAGQTRLERRLARRTGGKVARVGTWHSHPRSGPAMSDKDRRTMDSFRDEDRRNGVPTLLVISSPERNEAHLWI